MLTFLTMKTQVGRRIQKSDATYLIKIQDWLNTRYDMILRRYPWPQLVKTKTVTSVTGVETVILGKDIGTILEIHDRINNIVLMPVQDATEGARLFADVQDSNAIPKGYWREENTVAAQPTAASVIAVVSSSSSDTTQKVRVWGISSGETVTELVNLNGTNSVNTTNSYTRIDRISKDSDTTGIITLTSDGAAVTIGTFAPTEVGPRYTKIHLIRRPVSAIVYNMSYKTKTIRLVNAEDIPLIDCHEAMISGAYADALKEQKAFAKAIEEEKNFEKILLTLIAETDQQNETVHRFIPHVQNEEIDEPF